MKPSYDESDRHRDTPAATTPQAEPHEGPKISLVEFNIERQSVGIDHEKVGVVAHRVGQPAGRRTGSNPVQMGVRLLRPAPS